MLVSDCDNSIELIDQRTGKLLQVLEIPTSNSIEEYVSVYAMEYFDNESKKWKLTYTCDKSEYDKYIEWCKKPELTTEEQKARKKLFKKLLRRKCV